MWKSTLIFLVLLSLSFSTSAQRNGITFTDIAAGDGAGIVYRRGASAINAAYDAFKQSQPTFTQAEIRTAPVKSRGAPGVAIFDFDLDNDLDIYVTNGPNRANSLYSNQLQERGEVRFIDVATTSVVGAFDQDSTGVCFGDIDNDGDSDLLVLGNAEPNRLFENQGGSFINITNSSGIGGGNLTSVSCSMGDVNDDGLLDVVIGNIFDLSDPRALTSAPVQLNQHNQLFINRGNNRFEERAEASGLLDIFLGQGAPAQAPTISWAIAMVDIDLDGDIDIVHGDDQGSIPPAVLGGLDRGYIQVFENDGTGRFTNTTEVRDLDQAGSWMGLAFADFDRSGTLDVFVSNFGNQLFAGLTGTTDRSRYSEDSRWFLQRSNGTFMDREDSGLIHSPFGWGTSAADYDNDGDSDIIYHGGLDAGVGIVTSPGTVLNNDGQGRFDRDINALGNSTDHQRRSVHGMAVGDLNDDGFVDIVSVSNFNIQNDIPLFPISPLGNPEFDSDGAVVAVFNPVNAQGTAFRWSGFVFEDGTLSVELNSGNNGNNWVMVDPIGTTGITSDGQVNRDAIGAVLRLTPNGMAPELRPILGGSSYASQDALVAYFGMGAATLGDLEVLWPGGVRNRLINVRPGERIVFPEIPCSIDDVGDPGYESCVNNALEELVDAGILDEGERLRFLESALIS